MEIVKKNQKNHMNTVMYVLYFIWMYLSNLKGLVKMFGKKSMPTLKANVNEHPSKITDNRLVSYMPMWRTNLYNTVVMDAGPDIDGKNHNTKNQTINHALYLFALNTRPSVLNPSDLDIAGLYKSIHVTGHLSNGYGYTQDGQLKYNNDKVGSDTLSMVNLAVINSNIKNNVPMIDRYDQFMVKVIENDMSILEYSELHKVKSENGKMNPHWGLKPENAITALASLKLNGSVNGSTQSRETYTKLFRNLGYSAFSLLSPNNKTVTSALYVLIKKSKGKELKFWTWFMKNLYKKNDKLSYFQIALMADVIPNFDKVYLREVYNAFEQENHVYTGEYIATRFLFKTMLNIE